MVKRLIFGKLLTKNSVTLFNRIRKKIEASWKLRLKMAHQQGITEACRPKLGGNERL